MNKKFAFVLLLCLAFFAAPAGAADDGGPSASGRKVLYWYDPMMPGTRFDKPGKSPFMDMQLVPKYAEEATLAAMPQSPVITLPDSVLQKTGVRTEKAALTKSDGSLRVTGIVAENERMRHVVSTQIEGRIDSLALSAVGDPVRKGQAFYSLYSPELYALQADFLAARTAGEKDLAAAARQRLLFLGVDAAVIDAIVKNGKPLDSVPFSAPADGILSRLEVRSGQYVGASDMIAEIQDLSVIWIEAAVPEGDMQNVKSGDTADVVFAGDPQAHAATVDYIYPGIAPETRTGKIRLVLDNKDGAIRPAAYAAVTFALQSAELLTVPAAAVLHSSRDDHVLLALGDGKFQSRAVTAGPTSAGRTVILRGLNAGDTVVVSGQFLIDSESNLNEVLDNKAGDSHAEH